MRFMTDDLRIKEIKELIPPAHLIGELPCSESASRCVHDARVAMHRILHGMDDRLIVVIGPCSIHDPKAAIEYARRLVEQRSRYREDLEIIMRVYFEKPRTTVGWKGLINDPDLDGSFRINQGLRMARELLLAVAELGLPAGCEKSDQIVAVRNVTGENRVWGVITDAVVVRTMGAVSPTPIASARKMPFRIWGKAMGAPTFRMYWYGRAPEPYAASRMCRGIEEYARSEIRKMYGVMKNASVVAAATNENPHPK